MLCQDCQKTESSVHLTQIVNNKKVVLNLCKNCAEKRGFHSPFENIPFPLAEFVTGMMGVSKSPAESKKVKALQAKKCPSCGLTFEALGKVGRFGCGECYNTFGTDLNDLMRKIHNSNEHRGKVPGGTTDAMKPLREDRRLREELKRAIEQEDFEAAAVLRDKIRELTDQV
jgi:protein arginine kinase activator